MPSRVVAGRMVVTAVAAAAVAIAVPAAVSEPGGNAGSAPTQSSTAAPWGRTLHEASNDNFAADHSFAPGALGFDLAEVTSPADLGHLPPGVKALVWLGRCDGATPAFADTVRPYLHSPKVFGYYLLDEPDPNGRWKRMCPAAHLAAESDYLHRHDPGRKTFFLMMNLGMAARPDYTNRGDSYTPGNTHIDLVGIDPYPCRSELHGCDLSQIPTFVRAATSIGWPLSALVPVYQAFGGGRWRDDEGAPWLLPTPDQAASMLTLWQRLVPHPAFDQVYSWARSATTWPCPPRRRRFRRCSRSTTPRATTARTGRRPPGPGPDPGPGLSGSRRRRRPPRAAPGAGRCGAGGPSGRPGPGRVSGAGGGRRNRRRGRRRRTARRPARPRTAARRGR
ncbi:hypothetical protein ACFQZC_33360 [Streptacidiphilus monticola]